MTELISRLRARADDLDKALDFMDDEELREDASVEVAELREAADALETLLAEARKAETLTKERDALLKRGGAAIAFVQTGGPLFTKDRLELLDILYGRAALEGASDG